MKHSTSTRNHIRNIHNHITGLGVDNNSSPNSNEGIVGQNTARRQLQTLLAMLSNQETKGAILHGFNGKSALIDAFIKSSNKNAYKFHASEITSSDQLLQTIRKGIRIKISENNTVIQGEVIDIKVDKIFLKTVDMESEFTIGRKMIDEMLKEKVAIGDVIRIIKETGKVQKLGKSFVKSEDYDALGPDVKLISCPEGEIVTAVANDNYISLHQLDVLNNNGYLNLFQASTVAENVKKQVDNKIYEWVEESKASIIYDILVIEDVNLLSEDCIYHLLTYITNKTCPFILGTLSDASVIKKDVYSKLLYHFYLIEVERLDKNEIIEIVKKLLKRENVVIDNENHDFYNKIGDMGVRLGIKYVRNIIPFITANNSLSLQFLELFDN